MTRMPQLEAGDREVPIEAERMTAVQVLHHGEADSIGIGHRPRCQALQPPARRRVVLGAREVNRHALARADAVQRPQGGLNAGAEERQSVNLGEDEVGGEQPDAPPECFPEETIRLGMMLIPPTPQRDPGAAIDEQPGGFAGGAHGTERAALQRRSR